MADSTVIDAMSDITISVTLDGINVPSILAGAGITAAILRYDPLTQGPCLLTTTKFNPLVGITELYRKDNATNNPLGIMIKYKSDIQTKFLFERRQVAIFALFEGPVTTSSVPIATSSQPFYISDILLSRRHTKNFELKWTMDPAPMPVSSRVKVTLVATELGGGGVDYITLQFKGQQMKKMDYFSQSDCFYFLRRIYANKSLVPLGAKQETKHNDNSSAKGGEVPITVYRSAVIDDCANPEWCPTNAIPVMALSGPDYSQPCVEFACFDEDTFPKSDDPMGYFRVSIKDLLFAPKNQDTMKFFLTAPSKSTPGKIKQFGTIFCTQAEIVRMPSPIGLFGGGWRMKLAVAVDFSSQSGPYTQRTSLHYLSDSRDPRKNNIAKLITGVGEVLHCYSNSNPGHQAPSLNLSATTGGSLSNSATEGTNAPDISVYAFGATSGASAGSLFELSTEARPRSNTNTNASFNGDGSVNSSKLGVTPSSVSAAVERYSNAITSLTPAPKSRAFGPMVDTFAAVARKAQSNKQYTVLVVLTDGDVPDAGALQDALINADTAPLSVLFVGVSPGEYPKLSKYGLAGQESKVLGGNDDDDVNSYTLQQSGTLSCHYSGVTLKHSQDHTRHSRRSIAEFNSYYPNWTRTSRLDIAAEILGGIPSHFMQFALLNSIKQ
eukprot:GILI01000855.1.p1 GENE.GILI01000855.1~~GILI01000855.1.p1  ORF type:complete len:665 (+),score=105.62 GILI01000855.1:185-2179(+)